MPEAKRDGRQADRTTDARQADHAQIGHLAENLLPALIAKLGTTRLGELEVREGEWRVRLRRPATADGSNFGRRATDRPSRAQPGHEGHGHPRGRRARPGAGEHAGHRRRGGPRRARSRRRPPAGGERGGRRPRR